MPSGDLESTVAPDAPSNGVQGMDVLILAGPLMPGLELGLEPDEGTDVPLSDTENARRRRSSSGSKPSSLLRILRFELAWMLWIGDFDFLMGASWRINFGILFWNTVPKDGFELLFQRWVGIASTR